MRATRKFTMLTMKLAMKFTMAPAISEGSTMEMHATRIYSSCWKASAPMSKAAATQCPGGPAQSRSDGPGARAGQDPTIVAPTAGQIEKIRRKAGTTFTRGKQITLPAEAP